MMRHQALEARRRALAPIRAALPIARHRSELIEALKRNDVVILKGETGSGKSTQLPQYIFEDLKILNAANLQVGITQPRYGLN